MKKFFFFLSITLLINLSAQASEATLLSFCFGTEGTNKRAQKDFKFIKIDSDRIQSGKKCTEVLTTLEREELFTKFIGIKYHGVKLSSTSSAADTPQCTIEVTKEIINKSHLNSGSASNQHLNAKVMDLSGKKVEKRRMTILSGKTGHFFIDTDKVQILCKVKRQGYEINISSYSEKLGINTSRFVKKGEQIPLGSFDKVTLNTGHKVILPVKGSVQSGKATETITINLKVL